MRRGLLVVADVDENEVSPAEREEELRRVLVVAADADENEVSVEGRVVSGVIVESKVSHASSLSRSALGLKLR
jgi:hypothetical protein